MTHQTIPLFSVPLHKTNIGVMDPIEKTWAKNLHFPPQSVGLYNADEEPKNAGMKVLDQPQIKKLKHKILESVNHFTREILDIDQTFELTTSWINKYGKQDRNHQHSHPNAMISGVYYIESDETSAPIIFNKPYFHTNLFHSTFQPTFKNTNNNQYNLDYYGFNPTSGDLFIFPSWLEHTVPPQESSKIRWSLAFNCFVRGKLGVGTKQLEL